jgi:hypothetical protein
MFVTATALVVPGVAWLIATVPPLEPPPPPPVPVGRPAPPSRFTVVVEVDVAQASCVAEPTVKANHPPFGAIG